MAQTDTASGAPRRRGSNVLRGFGFAVAIALGAAAIWLVATSDTVKDQRIGALAGMWGVLIGAYAVFGARRHDAPAEPGSALELRQNAALARSEDVASQREFQARLEALLRREVQEGVSRELAGLRSEVSALRSEILEKVGGQLRLERTETTRLFGSNLEALQREVRQLKVRQLGDTGTIDAIDVPSYRLEAPLRQTMDELVDGPTRPPAAAAAPMSQLAPEPSFTPVRAAASATEPQPASAFPPFRPLDPMRAFVPRSDPNEPEPSSSGPLPLFPPPNFAPPTQPPLASPSALSGPLPTMYSAPLPPPVPVTPAPYNSPIPAEEPPAAATLTPTPVFPPAVPTPAIVPVQPSVGLPALGAEPVAVQPAAVEPAAVEPAVAASAPAAASAAAAASDDPFASMPRIRPFTDFELDAVERPPTIAWREPEHTTAASASRLAGRHATAAVPAAEGAGGRRRRTDDSDNDVLARILEREKAGPVGGEDDY